MSDRLPDYIHPLWVKPTDGAQAYTCPYCDSQNTVLEQQIKLYTDGDGDKVLIENSFMCYECDDVWQQTIIHTLGKALSNTVTTSDGDTI